ncbi:unnamed protein product [Dovyalis caffra]|uniref:Uncharacterized protein n=1 Tax=Dovyalis caffra TaxID=77055 RepID=A0AAV1R7E9_9ROSI|nr:unnamed protein product [Dovyalis caffra]CAK7328709.1 unnamed protein product [Dovyalis caffra]
MKEKRLIVSISLADNRVVMNSDLLYCACRAGTAPPSRFSSLGTLLRLLVLITLGLIELRLISPLLTALLQAQPYLLLVGQ